MFVRIAAGAVAGIDAVTVSVEVNVAAAGQLGLFLVGLPDNAVKESEQRIRSAFENTGLRMTGKKLVVNLAPDRKSTRLNSSHVALSRMPSSA